MANRTHMKLAVDKQAWAKFRAERPNVRPDLRRADFEEVFLEGDFSGVRFDGAYLKGASMPSQLNGASFIEARMRRAFLNGHPRLRDEFDRRNAIFRDAHMTDCNARDANFDGADFSGADLRGARFEGSSLKGANLTRTNLLDARFDGASLERAIFSGARLQNTNFAKAILEWTMWDAVDLSGATGLETVQHRAPSAVTLATVYRSGGRVPEPFLRGTQQDIPEEVLVTFRDAFRTLPFEYRSCFVSYADEDSDFVDHLTRRLQREGVSVWRDRSVLRSGEPFADRILESISRYDRFVVVLSTHAVKSQWVAKEIQIALDRKQWDLLPIRLDEVIAEEHGEPFAQLWSERHVANFSRWKQSRAFGEQFKLLLNALRREG